MREVWTGDNGLSPTELARYAIHEAAHCAAIPVAGDISTDIACIEVHQDGGWQVATPIAWPDDADPDDMIIGAAAQMMAGMLGDLLFSSREAGLAERFAAIWWEGSALRRWPHAAHDIAHVRSFGLTPDQTPAAIAMAARAAISARKRLGSTQDLLAFGSRLNSLALGERIELNLWSDVWR